MSGRTKSINLPMDEDMHRQVKVAAASFGITEKELFLRCFVFANTIATERVYAIMTAKRDGREIDLGEALVHLNGTQQVRALLVSIDSLGTRLRRLEAHVASAESADPASYVRQGKRLAKEGPWRDPKLIAQDGG